MPSAWTFPVAGENEWSNGSWMPNSKTHRGRTHAAIDIYAKRGAPIVAPVAGEILAIGVDTPIGGNWVRFRGDDGIEYYMAHMAAPPAGTKGQRFQRGGYLGAVGNSGSAKNTKEHLHLSMKYNGKPVNPVTWFKNGAQANPDEYTYSYQDPRGTMADDPYFNPQADQKRASDPMRQNLMQMMDTISNAVAGGQRTAPVMGEELDSFVEEPNAEGGA